MSDNFYRAFEERYYAPREYIKTLRQQYLPFVKPMADLYPQAATFDAGCGRGEWLELMLDIGLSPFGVDLDEGMLSTCIELGLPAQKGDAIAHITTLPNNSQAIISAFHVIEHITFEQLRTFVSEALRVLKPGGLLIMETPNPENIVVATRNFYLDPTHKRPIPSMLLGFIAEFTGFTRVKTLRLQEPKELLNKSDFRLYDVFTGVSPDYSIIAQKNGNEEQISVLDDADNREYGITLDALCLHYDMKIREQTKNIVDEQISNLYDLINKKLEESQNIVISLEQEKLDLEKRLVDVYHSTSWFITKPIRFIKRSLFSWHDSSSKEKNSLWFICKHKFKLFLLDFWRVIKKNKTFHSWIIRLIRKAPKLFRLLADMANSEYREQKTNQYETNNIDDHNRRTNEIYRKIKSNIDNNFKGR